MTTDVERILAEVAADRQRILDQTVEVLRRGPNYSRGIVDALGMDRRDTRRVAIALKDLEDRGLARSWLVEGQPPSAGGSGQRRYYELLP